MKYISLLTLLLASTMVVSAQPKPKKSAKTKFSIIGCWSAAQIGDGTEYHFYPDKHFSIITPTKPEKGKYEYVNDIIILHFINDNGKPDRDETLRLAVYGNTKLLGTSTTVNDVKDFFTKGTCTY